MRQLKTLFMYRGCIQRETWGRDPTYNNMKRESMRKGYREGMGADFMSLNNILWSIGNPLPELTLTPLHSWLWILYENLEFGLSTENVLIEEEKYKEDHALLVSLDSQHPLLIPPSALPTSVVILLSV